MPEFSALPRVFWIALAAGWGASVGSFLNVVIHRLPRGQSLLRPPSTCPSCGRRLRPWENVPLLGWVLLRGRCAGCGGRISSRYPLVEAAGALLGVGCVLRYGPSAEAALTFLLLSAMLAVAFIDWEFMIIPDVISLGLLGVGLVAAPFAGPGLVSALVGALAAGGLLLAVGWIWEKTRGVEAMGGGDVKLMAAVGAFLGVLPALLVIFLGAFLGAVVGTIFLQRRGQSRLAFGTFLALATGIVVFVGNDLIDWYLSLLRAGA